jgi:hypothetical protein
LQASGEQVLCGLVRLPREKTVRIYAEPCIKEIFSSKQLAV